MSSLKADEPHRIDVGFVDVKSMEEWQAEFQPQMDELSAAADD